MIVTGGVSGIGAALVRNLPSYGARVVSCDLNEAEGRAVTESSPTSFIRCDVTDQHSVLDAVEVATQELGGLDVLVHCAGTAPGVGGRHHVGAVELCPCCERHRDVPDQPSRAASPDPSRRGQIVNLASAAGIIGYPATGGVCGVQRCCAGLDPHHRDGLGEAWNHGECRVAGARTPMYERTRASMTPEQLSAHDAFLMASIPIGGQMGDVDRDLVPVIVLLASEGSGFMTGQTFSVDGGQLMVH